MSEAMQPTSEWEHSHALETGDVIVDDGSEFAVEVHADGSVTFDGETFSESAVTNALAHGEIERTNGDSHELATF